MTPNQETPIIPLAGKVTISPLSSEKVFKVHCAGLTANELNRLVDFFIAMGGRAGAFCFEYESTVYPACRFDSDELPHDISSPGPYSLKFPVKVLRTPK
jgi:hypothetical protein